MNLATIFQPEVRHYRRGSKTWSYNIMKPPLVSEEEWVIELESILTVNPCHRAHAWKYSDLRTTFFRCITVRFCRNLYLKRRKQGLLVGVSWFYSLLRSMKVYLRHFRLNFIESEQIFLVFVVHSELLGECNDCGLQVAQDSVSYWPLEKEL